MINSNYKNLTPFKWCVIQNFPFIEADFDAITNYQLFCKVVEYLNKVIENVNVIGEKESELINNFNSLKNYVENYFKDLDIQEEVNNKLDEMAQDGQLTELITSYLNLKCILAFSNIADMRIAPNLINGSYVKTYGQNVINDGYGAFYFVREIKNTDIVDNINIVALLNENLVAEKIVDISEKKVLSEIVDSELYGQIIHEYENKVTQSFTMFSNSLVTALSGSTSSDAVLIKIDLVTGTIIKKAENLNIGHANDITYCEKDNLLYIACGGGSNGLSKVSVFNTDLEFIKDIDFTNKANGNPYGIAYNKNTDTFFVLSSNKLCVFDYTLDNLLKSSTLQTQNKDYIQQSIFTDGIYVYNIVNIKNSLDQYNYFNKFDVYDANSLKFYTSQKVSITGEIEACVYYNDELYLLKITLGFGAVFKGNNYNTNKTYNYIDRNYIYSNTFPGLSFEQTLYVNSNYKNFLCDGSESKPINKLNFATSILYDVPLVDKIILTGDFSDENINVKFYKKPITFKGSSNVERVKVGGIYFRACPFLTLENIEIVKRSAAQNSLLYVFAINYLYLKNINFNGQGTENYCIYAVTTNINGTQLYFNSVATNNENMVYCEENGSIFLSGEIQVNNGGGFQFKQENNKLWYRPPINCLKSNTSWKTHILGGGITFRLADITLEGNYRVESGNTCSDAPSGLTTNAFRFIVENNNQNMIYKLIPLNQNKLYIGVKNESQSNIVWKEII